eukprot:1062564-Amphidinium_carterae.1
MRAFSKSCSNSKELAPTVATSSPSTTSPVQNPEDICTARTSARNLSQPLTTTYQLQSFLVGLLSNLSALSGLRKSSGQATMSCKGPFPSGLEMSEKHSTPNVLNDQ